MTFKSFLFGSAAALLSVSGAHAAEPIVVEPEPMVMKEVDWAQAMAVVRARPPATARIRLASFKRISVSLVFV